MKKPTQYKPIRSNVKKFSLESKGGESSRVKGYGSVWQQYRWKFLYYNNSCYACGREGSKGTKSVKGIKLHVDHVRSHKGDMSVFWDEKNYIPLCHSCHSQVTGLFDTYDPPRTKEKIRWINRQRSLFNITVRVKVVPFGRLSREIDKLIK